MRIAAVVRVAALLYLGLCLWTAQLFHVLLLGAALVGLFLERRSDAALLIALLLLGAAALQAHRGAGPLPVPLGRRGAPARRGGARARLSPGAGAGWWR